VRLRYTGSEFAMPKKGPGSRSLVRPSETQNSALERDDLYFFAKSVYKAAKALAGTLQLGSNPLGEYDVYPVLFIYRNAVELYLKAMVLGEGGNFLATKPDYLSVGKTRSLSWLAQFVSQIVTVLHWEDMFRCEGVENLAAFRTLIGEVNGIDVGHGIFQISGDLVTSLPELLCRLDALLRLLDSTADALAGEWGLRNEALSVDGGWPGGDDFEPTIQ
jgi:hypothetical protein